MKRFLPKQKRVFVLLLALLAGMGTAYAYSFSAVCPTGQTLYYNITDAANHYVELTCPGNPYDDPWEGAAKPTGAITLPSSVTYNGVNYTVKAIGDNAFSNCSGLTGTLTIPNSVNTIGNGAFNGCSGFTGSLTIPNSVTTIGILAFTGCSGFDGSLSISDSVTTIGISAFQGCLNFTGALTLPNSLTAIEDFSFYNCSGFTGTLTIPNSVTSIGEYAFSNCSFTGTLTLGNSLTSIGKYAFDYCSGFTGSLSIPNSVATIGNCAFRGCTGFTGSLTLGNSVTTIGNWAFYNCFHFTGSLIIPNSVTTIGNRAFAWCHDFNGTLIIGTGVTSIGENAFEDCTYLNSIVVYPEIPPTLGSDAFANVPTAIPVTVPCGKVDAYQSVSGWDAFTNMQEDCDFLIYSINPDGVSVTVTGHLDGTAATGELIIPETKVIDGVSYTVTAINGYAFYNCSGLTGSLTIPNTITTIGSRAFDGCTGFTGSLTIGNSVTTIGNGAFNNCTGFTGSLILPNSVISIDNYSFFGCTGFTGSLTIPNSVTEIGHYAFTWLSGLTGSLTIPNSITEIPEGAFEYCQNLSGNLILPNSLTTIGYGAFLGCHSFTGPLTIPNSVTTIGDYAFSGCFGFTGALTIGHSVTSIGESAFKNCSDLISIMVYPETPPTLGTDAFANVPKNIPVYVPCGSLADYQVTLEWSEFTNMQCFERLTVYDGTATNNRIPANIFYFDDFARSQFVMPAAELADMAGTSITSMTFYTTGNNVPYTTVSSADVYLKEVDYTEIGAYEPKASATTVYSGYLDIVSAGSGGEMTIHFSTPYNYQGGNLLIGVENTEDNGWKNIQFYGQTVSGASISGYNASSTGTIPATQQNFIPKTTFGYTPSECSRPKDLTATDITISSATLEWTGYQDDYDLRYRKKVYFFEDFENGLPEGWTTIDNDGDGYNWHSTTNYPPYCHSGSSVMLSASYDEDNDIGLSPDNWLSTPQLDLQGTMKVWLSALHPSWPQEHFAIYLSTTGNNVSDFTTILVPETTLTDDQYRVYTADLSAYAGQQGYIAIRHFNCTDMYALLVDDFGIFNDPDGTLEWETINDIEPGYTLNALEPNTDYEWQVRGRDCDGSNTYTEWSAANSFTTKTIVVDAGHPFTEGFEGTAFAPTYWENIPSGNYHWIRSTSQSHSGSASAYSSYYGDIYLVMPDLELSANASAAQLTFWSYNSWPNDFTVGNNTVVLLNGGSETVLWSAETVREEWVETTVDLSDYLGQTIRLAFKYAGDNGNGWYVDDVEVAVTNTYIFLTNGNWNDGSHWNTGTVPPAGSDVIIQANATVPAGYLAVANAVSLNGGSITVADGGQLRHNTSDLVVTMQKNIEGYDDVNGKGNYYLLAFPFFGMVEVPAAMTANEGSDFYDFDPNFQDAEWRNDKQTPINYVYRYAGYLYASPESFVLSVTGSTYALNTETSWDHVVEYTEGSANPYNGWELLGNPFTYNAYVYAENGDELVPMEVMIYDENGDLQTITCGPIAPMQGFFVHVTETTTVCFRGEAHINDYVDLGLPSGLLWATCNVGANAPEEYGDYFAWGETMPKDVYKWDTYQYGDGSTFTKYSGSDGLTTLLPEDDAATANWGSSWRMPTVEDWEELYNNTTVTWTTQNGVNGQLFTGSNGNSLFLPAAGYRYLSDLYDAGSSGYYWSSSLVTDNPDVAWDLYFGLGDCAVNGCYRYYGPSVRAVRVGSQN